MKRICKHCGSEIKIEFKKIPNNGVLMIIEEFLKKVDNKYIMNYDGLGYYAFEDMRSNYQFDFDDYKWFGKYDKRFTHVMWFNK